MAASLLPLHTPEAALRSSSSPGAPLRSPAVLCSCLEGADVRDEEAVGRAVAAAGPIDILVCSHGVFPCRELEEQSMEEVKGIIDINLTGTFQLIKAALPGMKGGGDGRPRSIALISSMAGQVGVYCFTAYSATKFVLRGLAEALQQEVITDNIHVSLIFPPSVETPGLIEVAFKVVSAAPSRWYIYVAEMVPASVRVRRETAMPKAKSKTQPLANTGARASAPTAVLRSEPGTAATSKSQNIDDSYMAFLEDMKALGALDG